MTNGRSIPSVKNLSGKSASFRVGHEPLEGGPGALVRPAVAQQAVHVVIAEGDGEDVERELLHVEVPPEVAGLDGHAGPLGDELEAAPVGLLEEVALRSGAVVEFHGRGDQQAAAGHRRVVLPVEPAPEPGPDARLAPGGGEGRTDHRLLEPLDGCLEHLELELVLGPEVGEQAALREPQLGREGADRQPLQAVAAGQPDGLVEDALAGFGSLPHEEENYTNDRSISSRPRGKNERPRHLSAAGVSRVLSVALGSPSRVTPCATDTWRIPLRGRHLHGTVFTFYHWTTSFLGVSLIGGPHPARSRGPPKPLGTATSLQGGGVDPRHNNMLG